MGYKLTLEVPVFFSVFGFMLTVSVSNNLLIYRTCYVLLHHNRTECAMLGFVSNNETQHLEELVEPTATYITLVKTIVESIFGSVLCLFIAPWSDRFGRKPVLVLGFVGGVISLLLHIVFAAIDNLTPWFLLVVTIPVLLTGGGASFATIMTAYIADITSKEIRAMRMGLFDIAMGLAVLLGNTASSYLLIATNYVIVYCVATACHVVGLVYTIFFIPESLRQRETTNQISGFFSLSNFVQMAKTPFKRRQDSNRALLLLIMSAMLFGCLTMGSANLNFYFLREKLHWTLTQFTWFVTVNNLLGIAGSIIILYLLHTMLKIKESILIFVGIIFSVASLITIGFAKNDWQIYLGSIINLPSAGQSALMRAMISKLVLEEEVAKVLSAFGIGSNILGPISSIGYTALYNATIQSDAGFFNFVTAAMQFCSAVIFLFVLLVQSRPAHSEETLEQDADSCGEPENLNANLVD
ncbi:unnamed protein product [Ceutorhynchus assimilis]|uniref:Major facilitator superfamily (MFS) profile domain-containing protein n=1 Tax=Ceutorhynchus assimilis TaxID=467358 RepID=A0A9N9QMZ7_9CUCU|nr:unnamed protein product [Ceutorhynchus assimilis]